MAIEGRWPSGEYVLGEGRKMRWQGRDYEAGDVLHLDRETAERLGSVGSILPPESDEARRLSATTQQERDELRAQELEAEAARLRGKYGEALVGDPPEGVT